MRTFYTLGTVFKTLKSHLNVFNSNLKLSGLCKWELINQHIQLHCKQLILLLLTHFLENCEKKLITKKKATDILIQEILSTQIQYHRPTLFYLLLMLAYTAQVATSSHPQLQFHQGSSQYSPPALHFSSHVCYLDGPV